MLIEPDGGEHIVWSQTGHRFWIKVSSEQSGGAFSVTEVAVPPGAGAGAHIHDAADECWLVLHGEFRFAVGDESLVAAAGSFVRVPRGTPHGFTVGPDGGRLLNMFVPGGCEQAFRDFAAAMERNELTPELRAQVGRETQTRFLT